MVATRIAEEMLDVTTYYNTVFIAQWLMFPWLGAVQMLAVITVWTACLHRHPLLAAHQALVSELAAVVLRLWLLLPSLALAGYVTGGNQVLREAKADPDFVEFVARRFQSDRRRPRPNRSDGAYRLGYLPRA